MRIAIREQLAALVLSAVLCALAIVAIPTWIFVNNFVNNVEKDSLSLTASLKAAQVSSEIELIQTTCRTISTRLLIQNAMKEYYLRNSSDSNWDLAAKDLLSALTTGDDVNSTRANLLQARLYSRNDTGKSDTGLFQVSAPAAERIKLPYKTSNGSDVYLGDGGQGYPAALYPNITYYPTNKKDPLWPSVNLSIARPFPDVRIDAGADGLMFGPLVLSLNYALMSLTLPIRSNSDSTIILGYMTMVAEASSLISIMKSREGLGETGSVLIIGPDSGWNRFNKYTLPATASRGASTNFSDTKVRFVLPPIPPPTGTSERHPDYNFASGNYQDTFKVTQYPAVLWALTHQNTAVNNASAVLSTYNEQGLPVAAGYARPQTSLVNWTLVVEKDKSEAYRPVDTLRKILLGCVFGTCAANPAAQIGNREVSRAPGYASMSEFDYDEDDPDMPPSTGHSSRSRKGFFAKLKRRFRRRRRPGPSPSVPDSDPRRRVFKIPGKVLDRKHWVTDELTELTTVFNDMGDELLKQYTSLDEKVAERTSELELSKKAAEAANESKTLFIANISHELKTPLNGILGMCAVCMEEDDLMRIKQSLKTLYKSGDLLLHLLEDLLSFSKNQIGQQLSLEEKEFRLGDIRSQVLTIFDKQVREGKIVFSVDFLSTDMDPGRSPERASTEIIDPKLPAIGPHGTGRLKDMCLWGDQHRILQVLINLVSNSLKFTPAGGKVSVRIRCVGEIEQRMDESRSSSFSRGSGRPGRTRHRMGSGSNHSASSNHKGQGNSQSYKGGTALSINPMDPKATPHVQVRERSPTPPPSNAKAYMFEFEVEDTGPGIPEHMQRRVFEPFVQGDLGLSKKFGGTGLGLSICQQLASLMGGNIDLRSTVGTGTTFTMHIPLKYTKDRPSSTASSSMKSRAPSVTSAEGENIRNSIPAKTAAAKTTTAEAKVTMLDQQPRLVGLSQPFFASHPQPGPKPSAEEHFKAIDRAMANKTGTRLRVLVADDNSTNIEVVSRMLKLEDIYDVTIAKDGQEAYDLVKANMDKNLNFDVIFMDIQMPNLDGLQSTRLIRKMGYSAPIVALTAFSEESNVRECMESGMDEFLAKPIRRPALKQVLKRFATIPEEPETASVKSKTPSPTTERSPAPVPTSNTMPEAEEKPEVREKEHVSMNGAPPHLPANGITTNGL
ncbi:osmolarity two-component system protein sln1 [Apiospora hydei]|uniref:histidine kinase n=1 Tax=Apiospora hydei TaxID=1337664 RepID=A0ABR1X1Y4_9PEZI